MSPEQGHAEIIDARSDLYSLGVVFYEMLIGRKPYNGATAMEVIYKHKRAELPEIAPQFAAYEGRAAPLARQGSRRSLSIRRRAAGGHLRSENSGMSGAAAFAHPLLRAATPACLDCGGVRASRGVADRSRELREKGGIDGARVDVCLRGRSGADRQDVAARARRAAPLRAGRQADRCAENRAATPGARALCDAAAALGREPASRSARWT